jgi:hypothetical protein
MQFTSLDIAGYKGQPVPNTLLWQEKPATHLGIVLPGYRHSADRSDLYYAAHILTDRGADVLRVEYAYPRTNMMQLPDAEQDAWIAADARAACNKALAERPYEKITLIGKSLGTLGMGHLLADERLRGAQCVWSTPLLGVPWLVERIREVKPRSMFIVGTADGHYKPDVLKQLVEATGGRATIIEGANHGLEIPGDIDRSLRAVEQIVHELQAFLAG